MGFSDSIVAASINAWHAASVDHFGYATDLFGNVTGGTKPAAGGTSPATPPGPDDEERTSWGQGSSKSVRAAQERHYNDHGDEVGAKDFDDYLRKADAFKERVLKKGVKFREVPGYTDDVFRHPLDGKYIDLQHIYNEYGTIIDYKIISFGRL